MSHRFDFLRPWPFSYYAKIAALFFTLGAGMEFTYIQTGYYNTLIKGASKDQDFFKDLSKQMLQLHEENMRKQEEAAKGSSGDSASSKR